MLRYVSPVNYFRRTATRDAEVGGVPIAAGEKVTLWYSAANRDESQFPDPDRFDVGRTPNEHVAFGGRGPHFCLGANLARLEITVMFEELLRDPPRHGARRAGRAAADEPHQRHQAHAGDVHPNPARLGPGPRPPSTPDRDDGPGAGRTAPRCW